MIIRNFPKEARAALTDATSLVHVSAVSIWEIAIKSKLDKIDVESEDLVHEITTNDFVELPISAQYAQLAGSLPRHHDDPFDRMLIAQAQLEGLIVVTHDRAFQAYDVSILAT